MTVSGADHCFAVVIACSSLARGDGHCESVAQVGSVCLRRPLIRSKVPDGFKGGHVTISWEVGSKEARILTRAASDPPTLSEKAAIIFESGDQISFLVPYPPIGVYMYSLFPGPRKVLISGHTGALLNANGATSKAFSGSCEITIK